ncbi:MAG: transcriptional repressor LexA [Syntrophales bacterium]
MKEKRNVNTVEKEIQSFFRKERRMPTYKEMLDLLGVRSKSVVHYWMKKLCARGTLTRDAKGFLKPMRLVPGIPVAGAIAAGYPSPAEEELRDIISIDEYLITRPESSFLVKVSGDSMTGAGIMDGDMVIVEKGREPKNGDIVLAEVDGEWTMKYFVRKGKEIVLEAANPKYPTIRPKNELRLGGIITAVIRKYRL